LVVGLAVAIPVLAAEGGDAAAQREAIRNERAAIEVHFKAGEAECKQRFAVSGCIAELQAQRRQELEALRQRELVLDEAGRKAQAQESARRLDAKRAEAQSRQPPAPRVAPAGAGAAPAAGAPGPNARASKPSKTADDAATAAARVEAQQRRASEAAAHREAVEQRNAERAAQGKKSTPLPLPAPLPPASAASR
jgi:hypothetical protein